MLPVAHACVRAGPGRRLSRARGLGLGGITVLLRAGEQVEGAGRREGRRKEMQRGGGDEESGTDDSAAIHCAAKPPGPLLG